MQQQPGVGEAGAFVSEVVLDVRPKQATYMPQLDDPVGTTSVVIRKNWNDTEKISMAPAQG